MFLAVTFLTVCSQIHFGDAGSYTCFPNSRIMINGVLCVCDSSGKWSEKSCEHYDADRQQICKPGQIVWQGCRQCICQEDGQMDCNNMFCPVPPTKPILREGLTIVGPRCTPFRSYFVDCNICVCPASGRSQEAHCAMDTSCDFKDSIRPESFFLKPNTKCMPKVMYLFPCLHCLCSDIGILSIDKCVETCQSVKEEHEILRCIPKALYRKSCNICLCPVDGIPNEKLCSKRDCYEKSLATKHLKDLRSKTDVCIPNSFTKKRCFYCDCTREGMINVSSCLESDCILGKDIEYTYSRKSCSPGEIVPICTECFCLNGGITNDTYCTQSCSEQNKLHILEKVLKDASENSKLIAAEKIKTNMGQFCEPNMLFLDVGRYCLCPENGNSNFKICTTSAKEFDLAQQDSRSNVKIDFSMNCEPNTFLEFECNTCFCLKNGTLDPKWCTYDDCEAKLLIQDSHKVEENFPAVVPEPGTCTPGSISKIDCNFCICPESGLLQDKACTKNQCSGNTLLINQDKFNCEPLTYYEVDCNICLCPKDGLKNVAKCTKGLCEKSFLRSKVCVPGQLFSDECDVCVCPPNGDKVDKVCTNHTCPDAATAWKKIFKLSQTMLGNEATSSQGTTRNLDLCFPGEEFLEGCKLCVCPEMGLRAYATCTSTFCGEEENKADLTVQRLDRTSSKLSSAVGNTAQDNKNTVQINGNTIQDNKTSAEDYKEKDEDEKSSMRMRRESECIILNITDSSERQTCTPGAMYVIRCRQCICPYMGNLNKFCRPLPPDFYCEQQFPGFNYKPMGRRNKDTANSTSLKLLPNNTAIVKHNHTLHPCPKKGRLTDDCYICDCEEDLNVVEEHCFKSDDKKCTDASLELFRLTYKRQF